MGDVILELLLLGFIDSPLIVASHLAEILLQELLVVMIQIVDVELEATTGFVLLREVPSELATSILEVGEVVALRDGEVLESQRDCLLNLSKSGCRCVGGAGCFEVDLIWPDEVAEVCFGILLPELRKPWLVTTSEIWEIERKNVAVLRRDELIADAPDRGELIVAIGRTFAAQPGGDDLVSEYPVPLIGDHRLEAGRSAEIYLAVRAHPHAVVKGIEPDFAEFLVGERPLLARFGDAAVALLVSPLSELGVGRRRLLLDLSTEDLLEDGEVCAVDTPSLATRAQVAVFYRAQALTLLHFVLVSLRHDLREVVRVLLREDKPEAKHHLPSGVVLEAEVGVAWDEEFLVDEVDDLPSLEHVSRLPVRGVADDTPHLTLPDKPDKSVPFRSISRLLCALSLLHDEKSSMLLIRTTVCEILIVILIKEFLLGLKG